MTNALAITLGVLIVGFFILDHHLIEGEVALFLGRRSLAIIEYLAFWR